MDHGKCGRSCVDCGSIKCDTGRGNYPDDFCLTTMLDEEEKGALMELYGDPVNKAVMTQAAQIEYDGYCRLTRVEETVEFARRMGFRRIGIATCAGLIQESRALTRILRENGFEVFGTVCKAGAIDKTQVGIAPECESIGPHMCNPILQARQLARDRTEFNIVVGLCVGHDSLFYKYTESLTTTLVVKDRVTVHNPAAVLYAANGYYKKKLNALSEDAPRE